MASYEIAKNITLTNEGVYRKGDKNDAETCFGINREKHPPEESPILKEFWGIVDDWKRHLTKTESLEISLKNDVRLIQLRDSFYKSEYWDRIRGDEIKDENQDLANQLFDSAVHNGIDFTVRCLQRCLGLLLKIDWKPDGKFGNVTLGHVQRIEDEHDKSEASNYITLKKMLWSLRGDKFIELGEASEFHRSNQRGYFKRIW